MFWYSQSNNDALLTNESICHKSTWCLDVSQYNDVEAFLFQIFVFCFVLWMFAFEAFLHYKTFQWKESILQTLGTIIEFVIKVESSWHCHFMNAFYDKFRAFSLYCTHWLSQPTCKYNYAFFVFRWLWSNLVMIVWF